MSRSAGLALTLALAVALGVLAVVLVVVPGTPATPPGQAAAGGSGEVIESVATVEVEGTGLLTVTQPRGRETPLAMSGVVLLSGPSGGRLVLGLQQPTEDGGLSGPVNLMDAAGDRFLFRGTGAVTPGGLLVANLAGLEEYAGTSLRVTGQLDGAGFSRSLQRASMEARTVSAVPAPVVVTQPLEEVWPWYTSRVGGLLAWLLVTAAVIAGILVRTRVAAPGEARFGLFETHQALAVLALVAVLVHVLVLLLDRYIGFTVVELLVPFVSPYEPVWVGLGVVAFYLLLVVVPSFWLRGQLGYGAWRAIHYATYAIFVLSVVHGLLAGTDTRTPLVAGLMAASAGAVTVLTIWRIAGTRRERRRVPGSRGLRPERAAGAGAATPWSQPGP